MRLSILFVCIVAIYGCSNMHNQPDYSKYVNTFIGTGSHGHTYPGPSMPFGMIKPGPDTRLEGWDGCGGYHYSDSITKVS